MDQDRNDEPTLLPFPLDRIARPRPDADSVVGADGDAPSVLPFARPDSPHPRPAA